MATATAKKPVEDPFAQAATAESNGAPAADPFGQPATGGNFPKLADLLGCLLMLTPSKIEEVPDNFNKGQTTNRLTTTVLVCDGPPLDQYTEAGVAPPSEDSYAKWVGKSYPRMWINSSPIVKAAEVAMEENTKAILGRLWRFPVSDDKEKYADRWELEQALLNWRPGQSQIRYAWSLERYTDEEATLAREVIARSKAKAS